MIQANNLTKSFNNRKVLRDFELTIQPGEIVALVGLNGAGKTTLIRTLCNLCSPNKGVIHIDGVNLKENPQSCLRRLGVVLHKTMLYENLTCRENLVFYAKLYQVENPEKRIGELLDLMGLASRSTDKVSTYSRGMQQRLSVARALMHNPAYLLMDEVFSGLDERFLTRLTEIIQQKASAGTGILFSTHEVEKIFNTATRVAILHNGRIQLSEPVCELTPHTFVEKYHAITQLSIPQGNSMRRQP